MKNTASGGLLFKVRIAYYSRYLGYYLVNTRLLLFNSLINEKLYLVWSVKVIKILRAERSSLGKRRQGRVKLAWLCYRGTAHANYATTSAVTPHTQIVGSAKKWRSFAGPLNSRRGRHEGCAKGQSRSRLGSVSYTWLPSLAL